MLKSEAVLPQGPRVLRVRQHLYSRPLADPELRFDGDGNLLPDEVARVK
jgi:hypothetical protein